MAHYQLSTVLKEFVAQLRRTEGLASCAPRWASQSHRCVPKFSTWHQETVMGLAFLQAWLAWEVFLEESFILYLLGKKPPKGSGPVRYALPPNRSTADSLVVPVGRRYADWRAENAKARAKQFFRDGEPYVSALDSQQHALDEMRTVRNAIAHSSRYSRQQFEGLTRRRLVTHPRGLTAGKFLALTVPGSSPPESFLEHYLLQLRLLASSIVPS